MVGIKIRGLFGHFDYDIDLADGGMTILTGPNGYGKSTIIKCINALRNSEIEYFLELDFVSLDIVMEEESKNLHIRKDGEELFFNKIIIGREQVLLWKKRVRYGSGFESSMSLNTFLKNNIEKPNQEYLNVLKLMQETVGEVEYIEEQRLIRVDEHRMSRAFEEKRVGDRRAVDVVEEIPKKLLVEMRRVANEYSRVANELDSTYPERLFAQKEGMSEREFEKMLSLMQEKVEKLNKYGISNISKLNQVGFQPEHAKALKVYFEDFERKYKEYELLMDKLDSFTDMVNRRFKFKKIVVSNEDGLFVIDEKEKRLKLSKLSSGEKEILVLFYQLLFEVKDGVMLLVDEPEISLHIAWQRMFAEDLKKIVKQKKMTAIVATHSPQIVNGNRKIQRDLGALYAERLNQR